MKCLPGGHRAVKTAMSHAIFRLEAAPESASPKTDNSPLAYHSRRCISPFYLKSVAQASTRFWRRRGAAEKQFYGRAGFIRSMPVRSPVGAHGKACQLRPGQGLLAGHLSQSFHPVRRSASQGRNSRSRNARYRTKLRFRDRGRHPWTPSLRNL